MCQPEQQHRARYQTEGSRGAVKDRTGNGFPVVKLVGYDRPATLQVFIGTDQGKVAPHMFYQACRVSGKNSTPCVEKKIDGTIVIEVDIEPSKEMVVTCDCVGILKERNVDVEHRFPEEGSGRSKKKSTRCRMVFRTTITRPDGSLETLQVTSQPIVCTQPPGVPEICKKSLSSCGARGGQELFILGKNFLKDTRVVFQEGESASPGWAQTVQPDKEFLQQSHLVCVVPPYRTVDITEPVTVRLVVESSGKASEPHAFVYLPEGMRLSESVSVLAQEGNLLESSVSAQGGRPGVFPPSVSVAAPLLMSSESAAPFLSTQNYTGKEEKVHPVMMWNNKNSDMMMPPPPPGLLPISLRRSSVQMIVPDHLAPEDLKREVPDPAIESAKSLNDVSKHSNSQVSSMDTFHRYVSNSSLPSINVGNYLSNIESNSVINEIPRIMIPSPVIVNKQMFSADSSNLLTTADPVLPNQSATLSFDNKLVSTSSPVNHLSPENMSVIVNSSVISKQSPDSLTNPEVHPHNELPGTSSMGNLNVLISPIKRNPTATERLDAFVNSAAESHISPNPSSPIVGSVIEDNSRMSSINEMVIPEGNDLNKMRETIVSSEMQSGLQISPRMSPQDNTNLNEGTLCSLIRSPVQTSSNQVQAINTGKDNLEQQLNNQNINQTDMTNLMQSPPHVSANQPQQFSNMSPSSMDQHLSPHSLSPQQIRSVEISNIIQSAQQSQSLAGFQTSLEHELSPHISVNASQMNDTELNSLIQNTPPTSKNQVQELTNLQVSLEQQLSSQDINSTQVTHCDINNSVLTSPCNSSNAVEVMSNLQASLEHLPSQTVPSRQILQSEPIQSNDIGMDNLNDTIQTSQLNASNNVQTLSNIQATLEHHLTTQCISSVHSTQESMTNQSITLDTLNSSVTASQIQAAVSQSQALSDFQASMQHRLQSQVMGSPSSKLDSEASNMINSTGETSIQSMNQNGNLTNLQLSFGHMSGQMLNSNQQNLESMSNSSISLSNSIQTSLQDHVVDTQSHSQVFCDMQTSYEHHLNASSQSETSLERLTNTLQTTLESSSNQTMPLVQSSMNSISSSASNHMESLTANSLSVNDSQIIDLRSSVPLMNVSANASSVNSPNLLSPSSSRQSPVSVLTSPGISMSSTPTMALSPVDLANSQVMDAGKQNIILRSSPQPILTSELSVNPSNLPLASGDLGLPNTQSVSLQATGLGRFDGGSQNLSVQVSSMTQYDQRQEEVSKNKEGGKFLLSSGSVISRPQAAEQTAKKCEEGMPLPHELTQMSEHDLISYINPSCFDTV